MKEQNYDKWLLIPDEDTRLPTDIGGIHIQKLKSYLDALESRIEQLERKPLTKEEIDDLVHEHNLLDDYPYDFVRAIEERHGIK